MALPIRGPGGSICATPATRTMPSPVDPLSSCAAARTYSRAYLHHLVKAGEILGMMLLTEINLAYYQDLMADMRRAIAAACSTNFVT